MNPEIVVQTHNLVFGADVAYGSLTDRHDYFDIYVNSTGANTEATAKLFANAGGLRVLIGQAFIPNNCGSQRIPLDTVAENFPNPEAGGVTFDLAIRSTNGSGTGTSLQAGLVGYDYPSPIVQQVASGGPFTLAANGAESVIATLTSQHQFNDVSISVPNNNRNVRFTLYAQIGTGLTTMTAVAFQRIIPANSGLLLERIFSSVTFVGAERYILRANVDTTDNLSGTATVTAGVIIGYNENTDGGGGSSGAELPPNIVTLEQFGAVGDGVTDDSPAMIAAMAAINVAGGGEIFLGTRTYNIGAGAPYIMGADTVIRGQGDNSVLFTTTNFALIRISNGQNIGIFDCSLLGNNIGADQIGVANGAWPLGAQGSRKFRMANVNITNFAFAGFVAVNQLAFPGTFLGNMLSGVRIQGCVGIGFWIADDHCQLNGCAAIGANGIGTEISTGNYIWTGGCILNNTIGVQLDNAGNDGHGIICAANINHNTTSILASGILNGMSFVGCHIFSSSAPGIRLVNANGVQFYDCVLDVVKYDIDSSNGVVFRNNQIFGTETNVINNLNGTSALWEENINLNGTPFSNQLLGFTFAADANETLTAKQSIAEDIIVNNGVITNVRTITSQTTPDLARPIFIRNNQAAININFGWATGGTVVIPFGTSAKVASDGVGAVIIMSGT
jgi:hypothetical protein